MKPAKTLIKIIDSINEWVGKVVSYASIVIMLVMVFEVISRRFFNKPTLWAQETAIMIYGSYFMLVGGYGLLKGALVSVDLISSKLSLKMQHMLNIITYIIFFFPFAISMIRPSFAFATNSWAMKEHSWSTWAPPVYHFKSVMVIAFALILLQGISQFLKSFVFLVEGDKANTKI